MIYLDHNASTPVRPEVAQAMHLALSDLGANPSSSHREGQRVRAALERARAQVAAFAGSRVDEVVFVSGGTEGDHLAVIGAAWARRDHGRHVAFAAVEHHAVHGAAEVLEELGWTHEELPCDAQGRTRVEAIDALPAGTTVASVMLANNETGVVQPVRALADRAHLRGMLLHCDAVQAMGKLPVDFAMLGADFLVLSGHKFGGPKGAGALIVRNGVPMQPLFRGSAQEHGRRGGTENVAGIIGLGLACELVAHDLAAHAEAMQGLRLQFEQALLAAVPDAMIHGRDAERLPNTVNVSFLGARSDHLLLALDARGVCCSAGAACASGGVEPSAVLRAMGVPRQWAVSALRFSLGRGTTLAELHAAVVHVADSVERIRAAGVST
ncbi:MAG: cysteine desulfurase family protein [Candidatus Eisenbacteria bacterium]